MASLIPGAFYIATKAKIRNAQSDDLDALVELLDELISVEADFAVDADRQRKGLSLLLDGCRKHRCVKVAEADGQVVGMCTAQTLISTAEGGPVALVEDMVVSAGYRRKGIGRQLIYSIEAWARQHGMTRLQLLADRTNFSALDFYDKIGWHPTQLICLRLKWKK
jgi:N-acetylglutamate synthase-like GNAT family acetyltransferase